MAETVISAYNAARGSGSSRSDGSGSADPDDLMKGRTFIPRMSEASRKLLIEALQKAKKKRQERLAKKKSESDQLDRFSDLAGIRHREVEVLEGRKKEDDVIEEEERDLAQAIEQSKIKNQQPPISLPTNSREFETMDLNANGGKIPRYNKKRTIKYRK